MFNKVLRLSKKIGLSAIQPTAKLNTLATGNFVDKVIYDNLNNAPDNIKFVIADVGSKIWEDTHIALEDLGYETLYVNPRDKEIKHTMSMLVKDTLNPSFTGRCIYVRFEEDDERLNSVSRDCIKKYISEAKNRTAWNGEELSHIRFVLKDLEKLGSFYEKNFDFISTLKKADLGATSFMITSNNMGLVKTIYGANFVDLLNQFQYKIFTQTGNILTAEYYEQFAQQKKEDVLNLGSENVYICMDNKNLLKDYCV